MQPHVECLLSKSIFIVKKKPVVVSDSGSEKTQLITVETLGDGRHAFFDKVGQI